MIYKQIIKPILFKFDPNQVHDLFTNVGEKLGDFSVGYNLTDWIYGYHDKNAAITIDGLRYQTPILLSAGFDYNAHLTNILPAIGFGGVEVGSITARPCAGNPAPQLTRLPEQKSILVNKGLKNDGVDAIITRLQAKKKIKDFVVGVSIAKTNDAKTISVAEGIEDYLESFRKLNRSGVGDYYTLNISCPNAFGGETFAEPARLESLLTALATVSCAKPIYIKMPINLAWPEFDQLLQVITKYRVNGVIIGNLNKNHSYPRGALSGKPCFELSNELIRLTRKKYSQRFTIIGTGGIFSPADAMIKFDNGADLVQLITGMIYHGPSLIKKIARAYAER